MLGIGKSKVLARGLKERIMKMHEEK